MSANTLFPQKLHNLRCLIVGLGDSRGYPAYKQRTARNLESFQNLGFDTTLLWLSRLSNLAGGALILRRSRIELPVPPLYVNRPFACRATRRFCRLLVRIVVAALRVDLVLAESATAAALCKGSGATLICDFHGDAVAEKHMSSQSTSEILLAKEDEKTACLEASGWICVSAALQKVLSERHGVSVPTAIVPCSVEIACRELDRQRRERARTQMGLGDRPVVCYAGGLSQYQEIPTTLRLISQMRAKDRRVFFLLITRDSSARYAKELSALGSKGKDYDVLSLTHAEVLEILPAADMGIILRAASPVNYVASPTKCGEYLSAGVPVLTTQYAGDAPRVIEAASSGLVLRGQPDSDSNVNLALTFLHKSVRHRSVIAERCQQAAAQYYDARHASHMITELLRQVLETHNI